MMCYQGLIGYGQKRLNVGLAKRPQSTASSGSENNSYQLVHRRDIVEPLMRQFLPEI